MKDFITQIVTHLVDQEDKVIVKEVVGNATSVFEVTVDKEDTGKVIGKAGKTAGAIRTLLNAASKKDNRKYILTIL